MRHPAIALLSALILGFSLATARAAGIDTRLLYRWAERVLDSGGRLTVPRAEIEAIRQAAKPAKPLPAGVRIAPRIGHAIGGTIAPTSHQGSEAERRAIRERRAKALKLQAEALGMKIEIMLARSYVSNSARVRGPSVPATLAGRT